MPFHKGFIGETLPSLDGKINIKVRNMYVPTDINIFCFHCKICSVQPGVHSCTLIPQNRKDGRKCYCIAVLATCAVQLAKKVSVHGGWGCPVHAVNTQVRCTVCFRFLRSLCHNVSRMYGIDTFYTRRALLRNNNLENTAARYCVISSF